MSAICPSSILACGMRVTLLDSLGNVSPDENNFWVTDDLIQITFTPELATGSDRELRSGCDCVIASAKFPDLLKRFTFEIQKGQLQPGLESLMLGEDVILDGSDPIGAWFANNSLCGQPTIPNVALEVWSQAQDGNGQSQVLPYIHWIWPLTRWQVGQAVLSSDFKTTVLTGFSDPNSRWGHGPYGDDPGEVVQPLGGYWFTVTPPPVAECAFQTVTPSS